SNTLTFSLTNSSSIAVTDVGAGSNTIQVSLTATKGTLSLSGTTGLSFSFSDANGTGAGDGTSDTTMTFRGMVAGINAALDGLVFTPTVYGSGSVEIAINDLGNNITSMPETSEATVDVSVSDAP